VGNFLVMIGSFTGAAVIVVAAIALGLNRTLPPLLAEPVVADEVWVLRAR
jgi:hypothetical protein